MKTWVRMPSLIGSGRGRVTLGKINKRKDWPSLECCPALKALVSTDYDKIGTMNRVIAVKFSGYVTERPLDLLIGRVWKGAVGSQAVYAVT